MSYQVHRKKYSSNNRKSTTDTSVQRFDQSNYVNITNLMRSFDRESNNWYNFGNVLDFDAVNQSLRSNICHEGAKR